MSANIPTFLHNWDPMLADNFQGKWWDNNAEHDGNQAEWSEQPFFSQLQQIDEREELLKRLEDRMQELELDKEINHCWGRAMEIHKLLRFPGIALQPWDAPKSIYVVPQKCFQVFVCITNISCYIYI
ncbi:hypothetical protein PAXRUDRAFT_146630 [Paxillus rubicundulus Ve08.2h10]|uniref:Uncharacterized protein n=1 Tax=Paxillus rubicundulus Ve08.2h10 TaxID=930991 RepID=A0A0D0D766_9AGAM|nr:hypothetical protein PAXRUDRAFT_146630 [Paxillus rubicundulus Ve08.2h10]